MSTTHLDTKAVTQGSVHFDAIRGGAALIVFFNHTKALYFTSPIKASQLPNSPKAAKKSWLDRPANGIPTGTIRVANEAVIIFFVLSGYLVGGSVLRLVRSAKWSWKIYSSKRLTRLLLVLIPALVLGVTLDSIGSRYLGSNSIYTTSLQLPLDVTKGLAGRLLPSVITGNLLFLQTIIVPTAGTNISLWSLASEFWYYVMFPFVVLVIHPTSSTLIRVAYLCALIISLFFVGWRVAALFPLWVLGALVTLLPAFFPKRYLRILTLLTTVLLVMTMIGVRKAGLDVVPAWYAIGILTCALLYFISLDRTAAKNGIYQKIAGYFSKISYSLYLFHLPMAVFICGVLDNPWRAWPKDLKHLLLWALSDAAIVLMVSVLWWLFEGRTDVVRRRLFSPNASLNANSQS